MHVAASTSNQLCAACLAVQSCINLQLYLSWVRPCHAAGPVAGPIFVVQSPGSPMYPGMNPGDYPRGVAMTVFPVPGVHPGSPTFAASAGAGPSSPLWGGTVHMGPFAVQPSTPPRSTQVMGSGKNGPPFRGTHLSVTPEVPERAGSSSLSDSTPERSPGIPTMPGTFAHTTPEQPMPRMNARCAPVIVVLCSYTMERCECQASCYVACIAWRTSIEGL